MRLVEPVDAILVVLQKENSDVDEVHDMAFGKGERFSSETPDALPEREVEALDVVGLPFLLGASSVLVVRHNLLISLPEIGKDEAGLVGGRNLAPQLSAAEHRARAMVPGHDLPGAPTQRDP